MLVKVARIGIRQMAHKVTRTFVFSVAQQLVKNVVEMLSYVSLALQKLPIWGLSAVCSQLTSTLATFQLLIVGAVPA